MLEWLDAHPPPDHRDFYDLKDKRLNRCTTTLAGRLCAVY